MSDEEVLLTRDTFLSQFGLDNKASNIDSEKINHLYHLTIQYLDEKGIASQTDPKQVRSDELAYMVPHVPLHVRLSAPSRDELQDFLSCGLALLGMVSVQPAALTAGILMSLLSRIRLLNAQNGERCIVEAVQESRRPSERNICEILRGNECRRPSVKCRCQDSKKNLCLMELKDARAALVILCEKKVIKLEKAYEPPEYQIVL